MKRHIKHETGLYFERGHAEHYKIEQLDEYDTELAISIARQAVEEQNAEHWIRVTNRIYGHPPTQAAPPIEQFCLVNAVDDPKSNMAHESSKKSGIEPGRLEHAEIRSKAAEGAASFPVNSPSSPTSASEGETSTALEIELGIGPGRSVVEVDEDENQGDMRLVRPSIRNIRQGPQQSQRRVHKKSEKRKRGSEDNGEIVKRRKSSSISMEVNAESRTNSEERLAYECQQTCQQARSPPMHGIGGWTLHELDA